MYKRVFKQKRSRVYRLRYRLSNGPKIYDVPLRTPSKEIAEKKARQLIEEEESALLGLPRTKQIRESASQPIAEHVADFITDLERRGRCEDHVRHNRERLTALFAECGWRSLRDVNADGFERWRTAQKTRSAKTLNEYLGHATSFLRWLEKKGRFTHNTLKSVDKLRKAETFKRRALTLEEFVRFMRGCEKRRMVYFLACCSGLRRGELKQLLWSDIDLDPLEPVIVLRAETTKNKKGGRIPLLPVLAALLRDQKAKGVHPTGRVLPRGIPSVKTLAADLEACGITVEDERGYRVDFHALRHTFLSLLAHVKVSELVRMKLARHSSWKQTDGYTDPKSVPLADGIALLAAALPSSIASPNSGKTCPKLGNSVQTDTPNESAEVVAISEGRTHLAKAVPYWDSCDMVLGGGLEPPCG